MRRAIAVLAAAFLLPAVSAAKGCDATPPPARPPADQPTHNPAVDQPGPQADPGTCVQRDRVPLGSAFVALAPGKRTVILEGHWVSQTKVPPIITWAHNGVVTPATNVPEGHQNRPGELYDGQWSTAVQAQCGDTLSIRVANTRSGTHAFCSIDDLSNGPVKQGELSCEAHYTVP